MNENMKEAIESMEKECTESIELAPQDCPKPMIHYACFKDNFFTLDSKTVCDGLGWEWKEIPLNHVGVRIK